MEKHENLGGTRVKSPPNVLSNENLMFWQSNGYEVALDINDESKDLIRKHWDIGRAVQGVDGN